MPDASPRLAITPQAARKLREQSDFSRAVLSVRHLLECGGNGFLLSAEENAPGEGHRFEAAGIPVVIDDYSFRKLRGTVLEIGEGPAGEGFRLNHPEAVTTTFC